MKKKGELVDIGTFEDEYKNRVWRITIQFNEIPKFKLGEVEVNQE